MGILGNKKFTVTRYAVGVVTDGVESEVVDSTFVILGSVQPHELLAGGEWMERITSPALDLESSRGMLKVYTNTELRTTNESTGIRADTISYEGEDYEVKHVEHQISVLPHYKAMLVRESR